MSTTNEPWRMTLAGLLVLLCAMAICPVKARAAVASAGALIEGEIRALASSGDRVAALRRDEVVMLDRSGRLLGVLDRDRGLASARGAARRRRASPDEVLDLAGIADDDLEGDLVEETLDDEGIADGRGRRRADAGAPVDGGGFRAAHDEADNPARATRLLAASDHAIWIGGADGLARLAIDRDAPTRLQRAAAVGPRRLPLSAIAVAPDGGALAGLAGDHLVRSSDGGGSWTLLSVLTSRPRAVEISADGGDVYLLDDDGIAVVAHRHRVPIFEGRAYHLARCDNVLLILGGDGVYAWRADSGLERRSARLPARRLICSPAVPGVVLALGTGVMMSADGGRTWRARDDLPALEIESLALTSDAIWIGTTSGLFAAPLNPPASSPASGVSAQQTSSFSTDGALSRLVAPPSFLSGRTTPWLGLLPRVALVVAGSSTRPGGDRSVVWLLLSFPLGRARARGAESARLAADLLQRRASAAAELARVARLAAQDDESAARARMLRESLELP
jgi:hypothetical protein